MSINLFFKFHPADRDGVFICKIFIPPSRDLGINKQDLGKVGWLACHMNTFCFSMRFLRIARSHLAETARSSGTARLHMNNPKGRSPFSEYESRYCKIRSLSICSISCCTRPHQMFLLHLHN